MAHDAILYAVAGLPFIAASRAGNCAMIAARSVSGSASQRAISSSERPQPMHIRAVGCTTQMRLQGEEIGVVLAVTDLAIKDSR